MDGKWTVFYLRYNKRKFRVLRTVDGVCEKGSRLLFGTLSRGVCLLGWLFEMFDESEHQNTAVFICWDWYAGSSVKLKWDRCNLRPRYRNEEQHQAIFRDISANDTFEECVACALDSLEDDTHRHENRIETGIRPVTFIEMMMVCKTGVDKGLTYRATGILQKKFGDGEFLETAIVYM